MLIDGDRYQGYPRDVIDRFSSMGFEVETVVAAFRRAHITPEWTAPGRFGPAAEDEVTRILLGEV